MKLAILSGILLAIVSEHEPQTSFAQSSTPLENAMSYFLSGEAAWRQPNPEHRGESDVPMFWIREFQWGPGRDVLLSDAFAVFAGKRCEPMVHLVYTWSSDENRVLSQNFGPSGMHLQGASWRESPTTMITEVEGQLPGGSAIRIRDVSDLSDPSGYVSQGFRWDGSEWVALDTAKWETAPARVCS
jgi:hypothetical protein